MRFNRCSAREGLPERWATSGDRVSALVVPSAGMNLVSLSLDGQERLVLPTPLPEFMARQRTGGVPLLHPWANRLRGDRYEAGGREVDLAGVSGLKRDGNGFPMHGLVLRTSDWAVEAVDSSSGDAAAVEGSLEWNRDRKGFDAFPFPHRVSVRWTVSESGEASASACCRIVIQSLEGRVPVASGWHPYLCPAEGVERDRLGLRLPSHRPVELDDEGLPVLDRGGSLRLGVRRIFDGMVGDREFDDLHRAPDGGWTAAVKARGTTVEIETDGSWPWMQVYAPAGSDFVCVEPMIAPTAALSDGHARMVEPGHDLEAEFEIRIHEERID